MPNLSKFLDPKSVAIVGASENPEKLGNIVMQNLLDAGYEGEIFPINPKSSEILGKPVFKSVLDVTKEIDLAVVVVPAKFVEEIVDQSIEKGIEFLVIISAGFSEIGHAGELLEQKILEKAQKAGIKILGPNSLGYIVPENKINLSFAADNALDGNIGLVSQSGAVCTALLDMALKTNLGFSHFVSLGNKNSLNEDDFFEYAASQEKVEVLAAYLEEINDGQNLIELAEKSNKPMVILKPGKSEAAQKAIASHTGSLAKNSVVIKTAFRQAGIALVESLEEMHSTLEFFSAVQKMKSKQNLFLPQLKNLAIVTNAGGPGIVATDLLEEYGFELKPLGPKLSEKLKAVLPEEASVKNPVDVIGDATSERYKAALEILTTFGDPMEQKDSDIDAILVILTPQLTTDIAQTAEVIKQISKASNKLLIPVFIGGKRVKEGLGIFASQIDAKIPSFTSLEEAIRAMAHYRDFLESKNRESSYTHLPPRNLNALMHEKLENIASTSSSPVVLDEQTTAELLSIYNLSIPTQKLVSQATNISEILSSFKNKYPLIIKPSNKDILHKSDENFVYKDIKSEEELEGKLFELFERLKKVAEEPHVLIQEFIDHEEEVFIGANRDGNSEVYEPETKGFGHLLVFGKGGIYTEIYKDLSYILVPTTYNQIVREFQRTKVWEILTGARGQEILPFEKVVDVIKKVEDLVFSYPIIKSLDINPLLITRQNAILADVKIIVSKS